MAMDAKPAATPSVADHMKTVKTAWDKAPAGAWTDAALKHDQAARPDAEATEDFDAATHALA